MNFLKLRATAALVSHRGANRQARRGYSHWSSQSGQGLVEYLILVALMAIATMGIMRVLSQNVSAQFANITHVIRGENQVEARDAVDASHHSKKDLSNFMRGAASNN